MSAKKILVEACVESLDEALAAERGGADRLELCANLDVGGTTPSAELLTAVKQRVRIPVSVMVRSRGGSFVHSAAEIEQMRHDIDAVRRLGADMLVFGILDDHGGVNVATTRELVTRAGGTPVTFHRAFDEIADRGQALEALIDAGVSRVLTSGGATTALEGGDALAALVAQSVGRITIMAGGKVRGTNARAIVERAHVDEVHARCELDEMRIRDIVTAIS